MADNEIKTTISYEVDKASESSAKKSGADVAKSIEGQSQAYDKTASAAKKSVRAQIAEWGELLKKVQQTSKEQADYEKRLKQAKAGGADFSGDVASSTAGLRGAVDVLSGGKATVVTGVLEIGEAFADFGEFLPILQAQGTSALSALAAAGPVAWAAIAAGGVALAVFGDDIQQLVKTVQDGQADLQAQWGALRDVQAAIRDGLTVEDAQARIAKFAAVIEDEKANRQKAQDEIESGFRQFQETIPIIGDFVARVADLFGFFNVSRESVKQADTAIREASAGQDQLTAALEDGRISASSAVDEEQALASARDNGATAALEAAQAERDAAQKREQASRDAERAASEAARKAEENARKAADAQNKYNAALVDAARAAKQAAEDALRKAVRASEDAQTKLGDDLRALAEKANRAAIDAELNFRRQEVDAYRNHYQTVNKIQRDALRQQEDAIAARDFLGVQNIARDAQRTIEDEQLSFQQQQQEQIRQQQISKQDRAQAFARERQDRLSAYAQQRRDIITNATREIQDGRIAAQRRAQDAQLAYQRELQGLQQYHQARLTLQQQALQAELAQAASARGAASGAFATSGAPPRRISNVLGFVPLPPSQRNAGVTTRSTTNNFTINGAQAPTQVSDAVIRALQLSGL